MFVTLKTLTIKRDTIVEFLVLMENNHQLKKGCNPN